MPNRVIKESIKRSAEIDQLTWFQEVVFYRLMVTVDDFGSYFGDPMILRCDLFPMKEDVTKKSIQDALDKLEDIGLIMTYEHNGRKYLKLTNWEKHQTVRNQKSKFPAPEEQKTIECNCNQLNSNVHVIRIQNESESKTEDEERARDGSSDDLIKISREHDEVIQAAINAGYHSDPATMARIVDLYAEFGKERVLYAIGESVSAQVVNMKFLEKCCKGEGRKKNVSVSIGKRVPAVQYSQRDYSSVQESISEQMKRLEEENEVQTI